MLQILNKREEYTYLHNIMPRGKKKSAIPFTSFFTVGHPAIYLALPPINQTIPKGNYILWIEYKKRNWKRRRRWWEARKFTSTFSLCMPALLASMQSVTSKIKDIFFITICSLLFHLFRILAHILFCVYICEWLLDWCDVWIIWKTLHFVPSSFISQINLISLFCTRTHALLSYLYSQINDRAVRSYFPFGNWKK